MTSRVLFHFHTRCSYDSNITPEAVVEFAVAEGINILAPTDHNTIRGSLEVRERAEKHGIRTIVGAEYLSEYGDIIGLFLEREVVSRQARGIIAEIKGQGGLAILPHPSRSRGFDESLLRTFDGIEIFNARTSAELNAYAATLAERLQLPGFVGSDAHLAKELALGVGEIDEQPGLSLRDAMKAGMKPVVTRLTRRADVYRSQMIKAVRLRQPLLWVKSLAGMLIAAAGDDPS